MKKTNIYGKINGVLTQWKWSGKDHAEGIKEAKNAVEKDLNIKITVLAVIK